MIRIFKLCTKIILWGTIFCYFTIAVTAQQTQPSASDSYFKTRGSLVNSKKIFSSSPKGNIAFIGGSITAMKGWREMLCEYLIDRFPDVNFNFLNASIPSLGSLAHSFRFQDDVTEIMVPDLLFVEAAVNDHYNQYSDKEQLRSMEGLVRQAKRINPDVDIVFIYFADPDKNADYAKGIIPKVILNHEKVAAHYNISSINLSHEVSDRIKAGEFSWNDDFIDLHPSQFGHELYFASIKAFLELQWGEDANHKSITTKTVPPVLDSFAYIHGSYASIDKARLIKGFTYDPSYTPEDGNKYRPGFINVPMLVADSPGAALEYEFYGTAIGINIIAGNDAGIIEYSIDGSPFVRIDLFTKWSDRLHLPWYILMDDELLDKKHKLRIRLTSEHNDKSNGTACRIVHFLTNSKK